MRICRIEKIRTKNDAEQALLERVVQIAEAYNIPGITEEKKETAIEDYLNTKSEVSIYNINTEPYEKVIFKIFKT